MNLISVMGTREALHSNQRYDEGIYIEFVTQQNDRQGTAGILKQTVIKCKTC
jgi:hypothetical protein